MLRQPELVDYLVILVILGIAVISSVIHRYLTFVKPTKMGSPSVPANSDPPADVSGGEASPSLETSASPSDCASASSQSQPRG
ncbi:hypothetical protein Isop_2927 [Isosphaera pallida ATCC 43644]|uniref:Uncharacterized protein n=1 Tax=Isosphaera pallida (strain ATCC 43644 / DSM 9630 / IS1B) TaxID=575540 RepID=E8R262_ISOPI|nr:hypothetical protein [Isosphaera pallida]ADV63492.1 hypothetical protein Isop_2927 [Isosphaera pallida ATCC 43644]